MEKISDSLIRIQSNKTISSEYDSQSEIIYIQYEGLVNERNIIDGYREIMNFMELWPVKALFQNTANMKGSFSNLIAFAKNEVTPHLDKHGLEFNVIVLNSDIFTRFAMNQLSKFLSIDFIMKVFNEGEEAKNWLQSKLSTTLDIKNEYLI